MSKISILILSLIFVSQIVCLNQEPVIGILSLPLHEHLNGPGEDTTFLHAQYVKFLEQVGATVVPIHYSSSTDEIDYIMEHINGVLFTGGALRFLNDDDELTPFALAGKHIYEKVKEFNDNGIHFPLWATCMGHQLVLFLEHGKENILDSCVSYETNDNLMYHFEKKRRY